MMGKNPTIKECIPAFKLTAFIYIFSIAAVYALFIPLSYILPDFVQWWYIDIPPIIYYEGDSYLFKPNILNFLALVVFAPVIEEILFRGMLLHRWTHKWGMVKAVVLSSLVFGAVHSDPIGATAFGIAMCVIYLRTQSLYIPIICHGLTNLAVWLETLGAMNIQDFGHVYTLSELQSEWHIGLIFGILSAIWMMLFFKGPQSTRIWKLPTI